MMKQIIPLAFLLLISCSQSNKKDDARVTSALTFVNNYIKIDASSPEDLESWFKSSNLVTESFKTAYKRVIDKGWEMDSELGLGFDPVINGQDRPDEGYELDYINDKDNYVFLKGKGQEQFKLAVKVIKKDNNWLVDGSGKVNMQ